MGLRLLFRRLLHAVDNHGLAGTLRRSVRRLIPLAPEPAPPSPPPVHPFDLAHSVDTSGHIHGEQLATGSAADLYNTAYYGISPSTLSQAFARLPQPEIDPARLTFVDLGCGKGRAVLMAAHHGFRHVLGVELSPYLADIARANTRAFANVEIRTADAASVTYPPGPLLLFLYHPFLRPLLRRVLENLLTQTNQEAPSWEVYILFANPSYPRVLARFPSLDSVWTEDFMLSAEDAAADRHGITHERYILFRWPSR